MLVSSSKVDAHLETAMSRSKDFEFFTLDEQLLIPFSERFSIPFCELEVVAIPKPRVERTPGKGGAEGEERTDSEGACYHPRLFYSADNRSRYLTPEHWDLENIAMFNLQLFDVSTF